VVSGVGLDMGVLDFGGDCQRGRGSFGGEFWAPHCNQWGLCDVLFSNYFEDLYFHNSRGCDHDSRNSRRCYSRNNT